MSLSHHELCFGCGSANLFGLQMELEPEAGQAGAVGGRFFLKQDHQGPGGQAHAGVMAAALEETMALALHARGVHARAGRLELKLLDDAPVGEFVHVRARIDDGLTAVASAEVDGRTVAEARAVFVPLG